MEAFYRYAPGVAGETTPMPSHTGNKTRSKSPSHASFAALLSALFAFALCGVLGVLAAPAANAQTPPIPVGANLMGVADYDTQLLFVNVMDQGRGFGKTTDPNDFGIPHDSAGWPLSDASIVFFDGGTFVNYAGTYHMSFNGKATVSTGYPGEAVFLAYDSATNTSTWDITLAAGRRQLIASFTSTQLTNASPVNTGVKNVRLIRPGYPLNTTQKFTTAIKNAIVKFTTLRFMQTTGTLNYNHLGNDESNPTATLTFTNWSDRLRPGDATQVFNPIVRPQGRGMSWELVIQLCNENSKDAWINVPISATDDYISKLALLFKYGSDGVNPYTSVQANPVYPPLNPSLKLYVEYGNEVWNPAFTNYSYNFQVTDNEITTGQETDTGAGSAASNLNYDNLAVQRGAPPETSYTNAETWNDRRVARRLYQISALFKGVYGAAAINTTIRPVLAWQGFYAAPNRDQMLFLKAVYGAPKNYLYALASAPYIGDPSQAPGDVANFSSVNAILNKMTLASDDNRTRATLPYLTEATFYGLKHLAYEGGTDLSNAPTPADQARADQAGLDPGITDRTQA